MSGFMLKSGRLTCSINKLALAFFTALTIFALTACNSPTEEETPAAPLPDLITVTPANTTIALGLTLQMTAQATFPDGSVVDVTEEMNWASSDDTTATVQTSGDTTPGLVASLAVGTVTITATYGEDIVSGSTTVSITAAELTAITGIAPANPSIALGRTQQFTATGSFTDGSTGVDITGMVNWSSSDEAVATINSTGLADSAAEGPTTITADYTGLTGQSTILTVTAPELIAITSVTPANTTIAKGTTQQYSATGNTTDATGTDVSAMVNWSSSSEATATIATGGLASALTEGETTIRAESLTDSSIFAETTLTVGPAALATVTAISPTTATIYLGETQQFAATGTMTDGTTGVDVTSRVTWSTSSNSIATINSAGLATGAGQGTAIITAAAPSGSSVEASLIVNLPTLTAISTVTPAATTIGLGETLQYTATGNTSLGNDLNITNQVIWESSNDALASIDATGLLTSKSQGTVTVTARNQDSSLSQSTTLTIGAPKLTAITSIIPDTLDLALGESRALTAMGNTTYQTDVIVSPLVNWSSDDEGVATLSGATVSSVAEGSANITASDPGGVLASVSIQVNVGPPAISTLESLSPLGATVPLGINQQFTALATLTNGATAQNVTSTVIWQSSDESVAIIDSAGMATTVGEGTTDIIAMDPRGQAESILTSFIVGPPELVGITSISPAGPLTLALGDTQQLSVYGDTTFETNVVINDLIVWDTTNSEVAWVNATGLLFTEALGTVTISYGEAGDLTHSFTVTVETPPPPEPVGVSITPADATVPVGTNEFFTAWLVYSDGSQEDITARVFWDLDDYSLAMFDEFSPGFLNTFWEGETNITADDTAYSGFTGTTSLIVGPPIVISAGLYPSMAYMFVGDTIHFDYVENMSDGSQQVAALDPSAYSLTAGGAASLTDGSVTANSVGSETLTVTVGEGAYEVGIIISDPAAMTLDTLTSDMGNTGTATPMEPVEVMPDMYDPSIMAVLDQTAGPGSMIFMAQYSYFEGMFDETLFITTEGPGPGTYWVSEAGFTMGIYFGVESMLFANSGVVNITQGSAQDDVYLISFSLEMCDMFTGCDAGTTPLSGNMRATRSMPNIGSAYYPDQLDTDWPQLETLNSIYGGSLAAYPDEINFYTFLANSTGEFQVVLDNPNVNLQEWTDSAYTAQGDATCTTVDTFKICPIFVSQYQQGTFSLSGGDQTVEVNIIPPVSGWFGGGMFESFIYPGIDRWIFLQGASPGYAGYFGISGFGEDYDLYVYQEDGTTLLCSSTTVGPDDEMCSDIVTGSSVVIRVSSPTGVVGDFYLDGYQE